MLVLTRKSNEKICIGDNIVITLIAIQGNKVRVGIEAPDNVSILREELTRQNPSKQRSVAIAS